MAVASTQISSTSGLSGTSTNVLTATITTPATNPLVVFNIGLNTTSVTVTSMTITGLGGTASSIISTTNSGTPRTNIWSLTAPTPSTTGTVRIGFSASVAFQYSWIVFSGADQTTPAATGDATGSDSPTGGLTLTPSNLTSTDATVGMRCNTVAGNPSSVTPNQTYLDGNTSINMMAGYNTGTTGVTLTGDGAGSDWSAVAVRIKAASGGGGTASSGSGSANLPVITETSAGNTGVVGTQLSSLVVVTETATGTVVQPAITGTAADSIRAFTEQATGGVGVVGLATDTLVALTESATGMLAGNTITGLASANIPTLLETAQGGVGVTGLAVDSLVALTNQATGFNDTVQPVVSQGGAPAWWGYEGFDGTRRPWWYKDLKDKAREIEALYSERVKRGILPEKKRLPNLPESWMSLQKRYQHPQPRTTT